MLSLTTPRRMNYWPVWRQSSSMWTKSCEHPFVCFLAFTYPWTSPSRTLLYLYTPCYWFFQARMLPGTPAAHALQILLFII